ncbi:cell division protein FtsX, partial [Campylobacter jejuni]
MKFFKTHLSLILPLLFMMFAFEFILVTNATLKHYEELV